MRGGVGRRRAAPHNNSRRRTTMDAHYTPFERLWYPLYHASLRIVALLQSCWDFVRSALSRVVPGWFSGSSSSSSSTLTNRVLDFDSANLRIRVGKQIAEGGFSYVYEAYDARPTSTGYRRKYALKRIVCADSELVQRCRDEAGVHRTFRHANLLPLLGLKFDDVASSGGASGSAPACYMLFPYCDSSLRSDISARQLLADDVSDADRRPYRELNLLELFHAIVDAVCAMHEANLSHRDIKIENVLLDHKDGQVIPILMDFGSAGPLTVHLPTRRDVLTAVEHAQCHTTVSYRPPELFDGGLRHGPGESPLNYGKVDSWMCGCLLFGMMYGCSPYETEFRTDGTVRVVECTHLRILGNIPVPPRNTESGRRYSDELFDLVRSILNQNRIKRPTVEQIRDKVGDMIVERGGKRRGSSTVMGSSVEDEVVGGGVGMDPFDAIATEKDFV